ncbi:uncharacterized protein LOC120426220 [Culex pipiens pallens]|uniref:uncharacterized protein LOC120426220 n=1 Tax=Culex pipiens pallens TaxID=42434 RepID=UPI00195396A4|nr:uncharacterized protein LOC120426220 [Culex pipiens pallens]
MAIKLLFLAGSILLWLHWLPATDVANSYSTVMCHRFRNASRATVYDFVTYSDLVDKWMSAVSFVATDQKPLGVGKTYKVVVDSATVVHFTVTDHIPGHHVGLESAINLLWPRLELWFFANPAVTNATTTANGTGADYRSSGQRRHHLAEEEGGTTNVISGDAERHHHQPRRLAATAAVDGGHHRSSLGLKFYFKHNSFLFQHTLGPLLRHVFGRHFRRSLRHLDAILTEMEAHRVLYS